MYQATTGANEEEALLKNSSNNGLPGVVARNSTASSFPPSKTSIVYMLVSFLGGLTVFLLLFWPKLTQDDGGDENNVIVVVSVTEDNNNNNNNDTAMPYYRSHCEYWRNNGGRGRWLLFQEATMTSMTQPSQQWSPLLCQPVQAMEEPSFFFRRTPINNNGDNNNNNNNNNNPLKINRFQAPDAILQVNFSNRVFAERPPILGFGGAFTEAAALNFQRLSTVGQEAVLQLLFGKDHGLGYSLGRIHINSCDFSIQSYSFDDVDGDFELQHFDIHHDVQSGMIDMARRATEIFQQEWASSNNNPNNLSNSEDSVPRRRRVDGELLLFASPWSPPSWMKQPTWQDQPGATHAANMTFSAQPTCLRGGVGPDSLYAKSWALYFSKFLTAYQNHGLSFWGITVQNEPEFPAPWEACSFTPETESAFLANHLGPRLRQDHPNINILAFDHNKDHINTWTNILLNNTLGARDYVDGIAYHWYAGGMDRLLDGALGIPNLHRLQENLRDEPHRLVLGTESCHCPTTGYAGGDLNVIWDRAERYAHTILADLMAGSNGWVEWNLLLDSIGGPNHLGNLCETSLLAVPHRAKNASAEIPPLPDFEKNLPFGNVNIGDGRTREELNALGFSAQYLDLGVVVQPMFYYVGHISRYVRPGSYAVSGLITSSSNLGRIFRPQGSIVVGGGQNNLARNGIEITTWPCEGSSRQRFYWDLEQQDNKIMVRGHDWLGHPTQSCLAREVDTELLGLRLTDCEDGSAGIFQIRPVNISGDTRYNIVLLNHPKSKGIKNPPCLVIQNLANNGGAYGPRGGAQVVLGDCETDDSAMWNIDMEFGEASSSAFLEGEVCMTTGWPFLQMGAFVNGNSDEGELKTIVLLNEANDRANFAIQDESNSVVMAGSIPPRSIQTFVLK